MSYLERMLIERGHHCDNLYVVITNLYEELRGAVYDLQECEDPEEMEILIEEIFCNVVEDLDYAK